ncbi:cytochrome c3 family protein [Desulfolithobacter sp.]
MILRQLFFSLILIIGLSSVAPLSVPAAEVCFQCHDARRFQARYVHKPVAGSQCATCHNPHVARFAGLLRNREDILCYSCHKKEKNSFEQGFVHEPVSKGQCSVCHTPHASNQKALIRDNLAEDCFACHEALPREFKNTHKPFADGQCMSCHRPHRADNLELLKQEPDALCTSCHSTSLLAQKHKGYPGQLNNCLSCHNPHGSERPALVRNILHKPYEEGCASCHDTSGGNTMTACLTCHENIKSEIYAPHSHMTRNGGNSCLNCHSPHAGNDRALLKGPERLLCINCHEETMAGYKKSKSKHPPVKKCSQCHLPHGGRDLALLKGNGNDVCVQCHEDQGKFTHPVGPEVLDSNTGQMVTCVSCHNPMGTEHKYHLIEEGKKALCVLCHKTY